MTSESTGHPAGQRRRRRIAMSAEERDAFLTSSRVGRVASLGRHGEPVVTPLWFHWDGTAIWLSSVVRSQRWVNLARDPRVAVMVDDGEAYEELRGVELSGRAHPVGDIPRAGTDWPELEAVESAYAVKYSVAPDHLYDGLHAWIRIEVEREVSWDHAKIPAVQGAKSPAQQGFPQ